MQELGREPTPEEVADVLGIDASKAREIIKVSQEPTSLATPVGDEDDSGGRRRKGQEGCDHPERGVPGDTGGVNAHL